jgi:cytochrome b561
MHYFKNTGDRYGIVAIFLHWIIAILILGQIFLGWYMTDLEISPTKFRLYGWHKEWGVIILFLVCLRILWRTVNVSPSLNELPAVERITARIAHFILYFLMVTVPLTGWLMSSAKGFPVSFFGIFVLPDIISPDKNMGNIYNQIHVWLAYTLLAVICLHVVGALKHHFIDKDNILRRIFF